MEVELALCKHGFPVELEAPEGTVVHVCECCRFPIMFPETTGKLCTGCTTVERT